MVVYEDDNDIIASRVIGLGLSIPGQHMVAIDDIIQKCSTESKTLSSEEIQVRNVFFIRTCRNGSCYY